MDSDRLIVQLKETMKRFRTDLNAAFGEIPDEDAGRKLVKGYLKEDGLRGLPKLAEYLLRAKDMQVKELSMKSAKYYASALRLSEALLKSVSGGLSQDFLFEKLCDAIDADGLIIWRQMGKDHTTVVFNMDKNRGEELFISLLPYLSAENREKSVFTMGDYHFIADVCQTGEPDLIFAALYVREKGRAAFDGADGALAATATNIIYNLLRESK